jgi:hypothetical protein
MARGFNYAPGASAEVQVAMQPGLHRAHVMALGSSRNSLVRATIASRPDCPLGLMVTLAHDHSAEVRARVASNPRAQRTVMAYLSTDHSVDVVIALLANPSLPPEMVEELAFHKKAAVRAVAAARLDEPAPARTGVTEDVHTPELAEHVAPLQGYPAPTSGPAPSHPAPPQPAPIQPPPQPTIAQIFAPHSTPGAPAPTRTAPVRGFRPKT